MAEARQVEELSLVVVAWSSGWAAAASAVAAAATAVASWASTTAVSAAARPFRAVAAASSASVTSGSRLAPRVCAFVGCAALVRCGRALGLAARPCARARTRHGAFAGALCDAQIEVCDSLLELCLEVLQALCVVAGRRRSPLPEWLGPRIATRRTCPRSLERCGRVRQAARALRRDSLHLSRPFGTSCLLWQQHRCPVVVRGFARLAWRGVSRLPWTCR